MPHKCREVFFDGTHCNGTLIYVPPDEPWCTHHYICENCCGTFHTEEIDKRSFYCEENGKGGFFCESQCDNCRDNYKKFIDAI